MNWVSEREKMHLVHRLNTSGSAVGCVVDGEWEETE
jgi:hypothetical protein